MIVQSRKTKSLQIIEVVEALFCHPLYCPIECFQTLLIRSSLAQSYCESVALKRTLPYMLACLRNVLQEVKWRSNILQAFIACIAHRNSLRSYGKFVFKTGIAYIVLANP